MTEFLRIFITFLAATAGILAAVVPALAICFVGYNLYDLIYQKIYNRRVRKQLDAHVREQQAGHNPPQADTVTENWI